MKYTEKEIFDIKKVIASVDIDISFIKKKKDLLICYYQRNKKIKCFITKVDVCKYKIDVTFSNNTNEIKVYGKLLSLFSFLNYWLENTKKENPNELIEFDFINDISPRFYKLFKEAKTIYCLGFKESSGMIYRKSLEILFKDYFIFQYPVYKELIKEKMIKGIIFSFYSKLFNPKEKFKDEIDYYDKLMNDKIFIQIINKTFNLGNDFAHYERRLEEIEPIKMKEHINSILKYLNNYKKEIDVKKEKNRFDDKFKGEITNDI